MAILFLGQVDATPSKEDSVEAQQGQFPKYNYKRSRSYYLISDVLNQSEDDILAHPSVPKLGSSAELGYPIKDRRATCVGRLARHPVSGVPCELWMAEVNADASLNFSTVGTPIPPTEEPILVEWETDEDEQSFDYDVISGIPVVNPNDEPYFDKRVVVYPVLCLTRYEPYPVMPADLVPFIDTLNASPFWGNPPKTCRMLAPDITTETDEESGDKYNKVKYRIGIRYGDFFPDEPWKAWYLCQGQLVRPGPGKKPVLNKPDGNATTINLSAATITPEGGGDPIGWPGGPLPEGYAVHYQGFNKYLLKEWYYLGLHMEDDYPDGPPEP